MADSAGIIPSKSEKSKHTNSINRTTSESLRLTETERVLNQPNSLSSSTPRKKTSFIITSITSRTSNDAGEDSADDLDESHTEDISEIVDNSRITDVENETPSYSEDTFSKDDVFFNASSSLVSAPVIPTSSQYGLALVPASENSENALNPTDSEHSEHPPEVNESVINLGVVSTKHDPDMRDMHPPAPRTERFKVVKIESTEPFKRGRWICMDYLDHPNIAQNNTKSDSDCSPHPPSEASDISVTNSAASVVQAADELKQLQVNVNNIINSEVSNQTTMQPTDNGQLVNNQQSMPISTPANMPSNYSSVSPGQSLQNNLQMTQPIVNSASTAPQQQQQQQQQQAQQTQSQSLSQAHIQQMLANSNAHHSLQPQQIQQVLATASIPQQGQQAVQAQQQAPQQPQQQASQQPQQQMSSQQPMQQQQQQPQQQQQAMMQPQGMPQQMPTMPQYQPQPQQQSQPTMAQQQQQFQSMQQQQPQMMQQQLPPQQSLPQMAPVQQVQMQPNMQQNMQQMPMQQQQSQQSQLLQQQLQQMQQQMPQQVSYSQPLPQGQSGVNQTNSQGMMQAMHHQLQNYPSNQMIPNMAPQPMMNIQSQQHLQQQYYQNMPQTAPLMNSQGGMMPSMSQAGTVGQVNMQGSSSIPSLQSYPVSQQQIQQVPGMPQTPPVQNSMPQYSLPMSMPQPTPMQPMSQPLPSVAMQQPPISYSVPASQGYPQVSSVPSSSLDVRSVIAADHSQESIPAPTAALLESLAEVTATGEEQPQGEDPESFHGLASALATSTLAPTQLSHQSASGASAVAIDNKIEQAMDLVKSHLMFAVREEVEVLKEKIAELMERITQLESENTILRSSANPDTLAQLPPPQPSQTSNPP